MQRNSTRWGVRVLGVAVLSSLAACAVKPPPQQEEPVTETPSCTAVSAQDPLVGNWLAVQSQKGVAGAVRSLFTLHEDGSMQFVEQVKRPRKPSQGLHESGCWSHDGQTLVLQTLGSNHVPVDRGDPIYTNRYRITSARPDELRMQGPNGALHAKRMAPGYRLPF